MTVTIGDTICLITVRRLINLIRCLIYFDDIDESEIEAYKGNSDIVAQYFNINKDSIENYLIFWTDELMDEGTAYENDEFGYEDWQLVDFMEKLGYKYFE